MDITLGFLEYYLLIQIISSLALFPYFKAAGIEPWKALVPFLKTWIVLDKTERKKWQMILVYVPVVNHVMAIIMAYEFLHGFNKRKWSDILLSVFTLGLYMAYMGFTDKNLKWVGKNEVQMKAQLGDWIPSVFFAVVAATTIRAFSFEAYTIPTPSMEKTLMVGDYLFVSKAHYGVRTPMTPVAIPLMHATIPYTDIPSFTTSVQLPYFRLPGFQDVQRNESFVFNYPGEVDNPIDKKQNYVKRCVAVAGDTLSVHEGMVYIDGEAQEWPDRANSQFSYYVSTTVDNALNPRTLKDKFDINYINNQQQLRYQNSSAVIPISPREYLVTLSSDKVELFKTIPGVDKVLRINSPRPGETIEGDFPVNYKRYSQSVNNNVVFPDNTLGGHNDTLTFKWSRDEYGPLYIPQKGVTVPLDYKAYLTYYRLITAYEGHDFERRSDGYYIDGEKATSYTFGQNYYWAMGDNRHNSSDSRYWGFVPETHIVGKPVFIWMSMDKFRSGFDKIRTDRVFTTVHGTGERKSLFWYVFALFALNYVYRKFVKKKKAQS
jgi:signal peptidase I